MFNKPKSNFHNVIAKIRVTRKLRARKCMEILSDLFSLIPHKAHAISDKIFKQVLLSLLEQHKQVFLGININLENKQ